LVCNRTCHNNCGIPNNEKKQECEAINLEGYCVICPGKCHWEKHSNLSFVYIETQKQVEGTYDELKSKYENAESALKISE